MVNKTLQGIALTTVGLASLVGCGKAQEKTTTVYSNRDVVPLRLEKQEGNDSYNITLTYKKFNSVSPNAEFSEKATAHIPNDEQGRSVIKTIEDRILEEDFYQKPFGISTRGEYLPHSSAPVTNEITQFRFGNLPYVVGGRR